MLCCRSSTVVVVVAADADVCDCENMGVTRPDG